MNKTKIFHELHHRDRPLVLPNAWDFGSAAVLAAEGFPAIGTTSLGVAVAAGLPDGTGVTEAATMALARLLAGLPVPVTVDIEGGFSETPSAVADYAQQLAESGLAGINLEDGRAGSTLAEPDHQAELIGAIKDRAPELFVNARVDTYWVKDDIERTLARVERYTAAGADGIFVPGLTDPEGIAQLVAATPLPVNILYSPTGPSIAELGELGVRRVSTGSLLYRSALAVAVETARAVRDGGSLPIVAPPYTEIQALTD
ncbi:2-methylisocitrate lyase-like PEP mutase family enzyme [Nocardia tenerifensis]|uniref:2-methylisocitrate lyase-like PEP mutase family enzyme n=1 Tax=Nocardia tenerifensis TaxID=228006 RepID=A0A318JTD6_9NOCA|nr:isocitrate lyase/phosphoenolpyruvate mutase family protein [Nocardia tenerifensis]PXX56545.1 2-methylisocitrate lyase-like PEP mutase family enzyme [Nocardia tenerifensis]